MIDPIRPKGIQPSVPTRAAPTRELVAPTPPPPQAPVTLPRDVSFVKSRGLPANFDLPDLPFKRPAPIVVPEPPGQPPAAPTRPRGAGPLVRPPLPQPLTHRAPIVAPPAPLPAPAAPVGAPPAPTAPKPPAQPVRPAPLGPLPIDANRFMHIAGAAQRADMGGLIDRAVAEWTKRAPASAAELPLATAPHEDDDPRASARETLSAAVALASQGYPESPKLLAFLAGETSPERSVQVAAAKLANRLGGHTEAEHVLVRAAERAENPGDALATARRAQQMGYPMTARFAYGQAAARSGTWSDALAVAKEASAAGLRYEGSEADFAGWKVRLDEHYRNMEGPSYGPDFSRSASPYRQQELATLRNLDPYVAAMKHADRASYPTIARAAAQAREYRTASVLFAHGRTVGPA